MAAQDSSQIAAPQNGRPIAQYHPSIWGDLFLNYTPIDKETASKMEQDIKKLKGVVKKELIASVENPLEQISMIDALQRLGIAYHFEEILEEMLQHIFNKSFGDDQSYEQDNLYHTSVRFRLLRQQGYRVSCDIFEKFIDEKREFKEYLKSDIKGLLSLYEASHVRIHGEYILDQALEFTTMQLNSMANNLSDLMEDKVNHALNQPLHKGMCRLESRYYITMYERDPMHNKSLLKLAKLDFNYVQSMHRKELRDIAWWWKNLFSSCKFTRDRVAEAYFWSLTAFYKPQYSFARKIYSMVLLFVSTIDDIYDAYGTFEELETLTELIHRWDKSSTNQLPDYIIYFYEALIDSFEEFKQDLAKERRAHLVDYMIEQFKILSDRYFQEVRWRHNKCIPSYDDYMENGRVSFGYGLAIAVGFIGIGKIATKEAFEWARQHPKLVKSLGLIARLKNDMGGSKFQQYRDHVASSVECYMKEYDVSEKKAHEELHKQVEDGWKDINEEMLQPHVLSKPLLLMILDFARAIDVFYKDEDGFTNVGKTIKSKIALVLIDQIPL